ncbi:hypothetical protein BDZ94DRAFT_1263140 [Collybia nuda]|uniref:Transmembrane protein n=1 Tax=Collybia nuda TaxID=64659 RepID=A0A9P5Y5U3_9AGAR|nr:hypothetical protein BDZ94DRAFT_1263140 [Collybia nuda]
MSSFHSNASDPKLLSSFSNVEQGNTPQSQPQLKTLERQVTTANAFAILSTLFAGVQAQLLSGIPDQTSSTVSRGLIDTLYFFSYGGLAINISASLAAIFFISFANILLSATDEDQSRVETSEQTSRGLHRLRRSFLGLTLLGTYFILLQLSLLAWTSQHRSMAAFVLVILVIWVSFVPLTIYTNLVIAHRKRNSRS